MRMPRRAKKRHTLTPILAIACSRNGLCKSEAGVAVQAAAIALINTWECRKRNAPTVYNAQHY
jgi:hypothetical protein